MKAYLNGRLVDLSAKDEAQRNRDIADDLATAPDRAILETAPGADEVLDAILAAIPTNPALDDIKARRQAAKEAESRLRDAGG